MKLIVKIFYFLLLIFIFTQTEGAFAESFKSPQNCFCLKNDEVPYGYYRNKWRKTCYGQRMQVKNMEEALHLVSDFYKKEKLTIIPVKENCRFYFFEARDNKNNIIDMLIVDKQSGRIRSIY